MMCAEALANEIGRAFKSLIAPVRSKAGETWVEPKPGQRAALSRAFGEADKRLSKAELVPDEDAILTLYRWARVSHLATQQRKPRNIPLPAALAQLPEQFVKPIKATMLSSFEGMFAETDDANAAKQRVLGIEAETRKLRDYELEHGQRIFQLIRQGLRMAPAIMVACGVPENAIGAYLSAFKSISHSIREAEWRAAIFLSAIKLAKSGAFDAECIEDMASMSDAEIASLVSSWRENC